MIVGDRWKKERERISAGVCTNALSGILKALGIPQFCKKKREGKTRKKKKTEETRRERPHEVG